MGAAFIAGMMNSVAGGGSFLSFPALVFTGVPSIVANATSTVAMVPGSLASAWAYRQDFNRLKNFPFWPMFIISVAGGMAGAILLLYTPQKQFDAILPWLMLIATLLFAVGPRIAPILRNKFHIGPPALLAVQLLISVYGGYFGGAIGILMLAVWSLFGLNDIHAINANKTVVSAAMNLAAIFLFAIARIIWWPQALAMIVAAVIGGYIGARGAKRIPPRYVRTAIIAIGVAITAAFFWRQY
jgi:uncharacterized membrane protein YfcA